MKLVFVALVVITGVLTFGGDYVFKKQIAKAREIEVGSEYDIATRYVSFRMGVITFFLFSAATCGTLYLVGVDLLCFALICIFTLMLVITNLCLVKMRKKGKDNPAYKGNDMTLVFIIIYIINLATGALFLRRLFF